MAKRISAPIANNTSRRADMSLVRICAAWCGAACMDPSLCWMAGRRDSCALPTAGDKDGGNWLRYFWMR